MNHPLSYRIGAQIGHVIIEDIANKADYSFIFYEQICSSIIKLKFGVFLQPQVSDLA